MELPWLTFLGSALAALLAYRATAASPLPDFDPQTRSYSLSFDGAPAWNHLGAAVNIDGRWLSLNDFSECRWDGAVLHCEGHGPTEWFELRFECAKGQPYVTVQAAVRAKASCRVHGFQLLTAASLPLPAAPDWMLYADEFNALAIGRLLRLESLGESLRGAWLTSVQSPGHKQSFVQAALTARLWPTWFEWSRHGKNTSLTIRAGGETGGESVRLSAGEVLVSDPVLTGNWKNLLPVQALQEAAAAIAQRNPRGQAPRRPAPGWCSWMYHAGQVSEQDVLTAAGTMQATFASSGYRLVQVDGGWWDKRGDWRPNERFPHGIRWLSDQVHQRGLLFGLHMSPFRIDATSDLAQRHPDWFVRALDNSGYLEQGAGANKRYILDTSRPEALAWLRDLFGRMVREWNLDYLKLDFLDLGAFEGLRYNRNATGVQAFRAAMAAIREVVPAQVLILGCNVPTLAGVEYFDSLRIGPDINRVGKGHVGPNGEHANMVWGPVNSVITTPGGDAQSLAGQARAVARNYYLHGTVAINDPDPVMVTPDYNLEEARAHVTLVALTGGSLSLGDRLDTLPADRVALLTHPQVLEIWREGRHAVPLDIFAGEELPRIWKLARPSGAHVIAVFNWSGERRETRYNLADLGIEAGRAGTFRDVWSGTPVTLVDDVLTLTQPAHSVRLLEASP